ARAVLVERHDKAQPVVRLQLLDRLDDLDHQRAVKGVELCRIVDRQATEMSALPTVLADSDNTHRALLRLEAHLPLVHSTRALRQEARVDIIEDISEIREIYGEPMERSVKKQLPRLEKHSRAFIALSPFLVIASADPQGRVDASPKGDAPGFVHVIDDE